MSLRFQLHAVLSGQSLPLVVCRRANVIYMSFVFACAQWCPARFTICVRWWVSYKRQELFGGVLVAHLFQLFVQSYYVSLRSQFRVVISVAISAWRRCSVRFCLRLFVVGFMSCLCYLRLLAHSGVQHLLCCVFCFVCLRLVYPILPVSLNCPILIAPSILYNIYLLT